MKGLRRLPSITDINDVPITYISMLLPELTESDVFVIKVACVDGTSLSSDVDASAKVLARLNGTADPFVDLATDPIDLSPFDGETKSFDMKVEALNVVGLVRAALPVKVIYL